MIPNISEGVVTQHFELFEDGVCLGASWLLIGARFGGSDEGRLGRQTRVVDPRQSLVHHERDGVQHSWMFTAQVVRSSQLDEIPVVVVGKRGLAAKRSPM